MIMQRPAWSHQADYARTALIEFPLLEKGVLPLNGRFSEMVSVESSSNRCLLVTVFACHLGVTVQKQRRAHEMIIHQEWLEFGIRS